MGLFSGTDAKKALDFLTPEKSPDLFVFTKFNGSALADAIESGDIANLKSSDIEQVTLKINPSQITYSIPKITQKVQTANPGRFIVYDWGTDLLTMNISGNTGNMLPNSMRSSYNPLEETINNLVEGSGAVNIDFPKLNPKIINTAGTATSIIQDVMQKTMTYFEMLEMSPKYRTFRKLQKIYTVFDADLDVLTLETGSTVYRGFFESFDFSIIAESPWNWKYNMTFVALTDLAEATRRGDSSFIKGLIS